MKKAETYHLKCYFKECANESTLSNYFVEEEIQYWVHICDTCHEQLVNDKRLYKINYYPGTPQAFRGVENMEWLTEQPIQLSLFDN